jgi:calcium/calmodulin-dependent protein kinase I
LQPTNKPTFLQEALKHIWLSGKTATDHDLVPELRRAQEARAKLKHAILAVKLQKRIAKLKVEESDSDSSDMGDAEAAIPGLARAGATGSSHGSGDSASADKKSTLKDKIKDGAVFREVVLAKLREEKARREASLTTDEELVDEARRRSFNAPR